MDTNSTTQLGAKARKAAEADAEKVRSESLKELGFLISFAFAIMTALAIGAGDPMEMRAEIFGAWMLGYGAGEVLRRRGMVTEAVWAMASSWWCVVAYGMWQSGALRSPMAAGHVLVISMAGMLVGPRLAAALCVASVFNSAFLWFAIKGGWTPPAILGTSVSAVLIDNLGMIVLAGIGAASALRRLARSVLADERQREKAAESAENFMGLFLQSPAAMALTEVTSRSGKVGELQRLLAVNESFETMFDTGKKGGWGTPASPAVLWSELDEFKDLAKRVAGGKAVDAEQSMMLSWGRKRKIVCKVSARKSIWNGYEALLWTFQDVTESERMRLKLEHQNTLLANKARATSAEARTDRLTKLPNRRALDERLTLIDEAPERLPFAAMMVDVDCFKKYNDSLGHQQGDVCLAKIGEAIARVVERLGARAFGARYGGEEFALTLSGFTEQEALLAAWEVCDEVSAMKIPHPSNTAGPIVTVSVGVSERSRKGNTAEVLKRADDALYRSKTEGRNRAMWEPGVDDAPGR